MVAPVIRWWQPKGLWISLWLGGSFFFSTWFWCCVYLIIYINQWNSFFSQYFIQISYPIYILLFTLFLLQHQAGYMMVACRFDSKTSQKICRIRRWNQEMTQGSTFIVTLSCRRHGVRPPFCLEEKTKSIKSEFTYLNQCSDNLFLWRHISGY